MKSCRKTAAILSGLNFEAGCNPNNVGFLPGLGWRRQRVVVNQYYWNAGQALPPDGNPIGSVNHFQDTGSATLKPIFYPPAIGNVDPTTTPVFALYDRWADAKIDKSEFVSVQSARSLATAAWLAAQSSANVNQSWTAAGITAAAGTIQFPNGSPGLNAPGTATLTSGTLDLSDARIVWDVAGTQPHIGPMMAFQRSTVGESRIEAEAALPDGRRVFGTDTIYVNDPLNGGTGYQTDSSTIALYHFDGNFSDSSGNGYNLATSGNVAFSDNTTWMKNPGGKVARFRNIGDQLQVSFNNSVIQPGTGVSPITIDARIYPRAYKGNGQFVMALRQDYNSQWTAYYVQGQSPDAPTLYTHSTTVLAPTEWNQNVTLNTWHNLRITYKSVNNTPTTAVYVDGVFQKTVSTPVVQTYTGNWTLYLGNFDGDIDEVRISNIDRGALP